MREPFLHGGHPDYSKALYSMSDKLLDRPKALTNPHYWYLSIFTEFMSTGEEKYP